MRLIDKRFVAHAPSYLFQTALATVTLLVILVIENAVFGAAIVVAVASTAFIVFVIPHSIASTPKRVIGGHVASVISGSIIAAVLAVPAVASFGVEVPVVLHVMAALSVGLGILLMSATNTEHPPAAGTALGLVTDGWSWSALVFILTSAIALSLIRAALRSKLINLI